MDGGYDIGYSSCTCFWGNEPGSMVKYLLRQIGSVKGMNVLDVGCGEGKNAGCLSENGAFVRAMDISELAIASAQRIWNTSSNITWEQADIRSTFFENEAFDLVIAYGLAHCLSNSQEISSTLTRLQSATRLGGYHVICSFNSRAQDLSAHPGFTPCLVPHEFFLQLYSQWSIIVQSDDDLEETHPHNNIRHTHSLTRILAQKTSCQ